MEEKRLKEIKDSIGLQEKITEAYGQDLLLLNEEKELYNEVIRLKKETKKLKEEINELKKEGR